MFAFAPYDCCFRTTTSFANGQKRLFMKFKIASAVLQLGLTLGKQADEHAVRDLISRLHPKNPARPLIRVGSNSDGGYLVPDDLQGIVACFSPGVGAVASFEEHFVSQGIPCFLADGSVKAAPMTHDLLHFERKFIGVTNNAETMTMDNWVGRNVPPQGDLILQMDIEGNEWPVLLHMSDQTLRRFRVIVMELHNFDRLIDRVGFTLMGSALDRLLCDFDVVHMHPNNTGGKVSKNDLELPRVMEVTFVRKDRGVTSYALDFPHSLDVPNDPTLRDIELPQIWYRQ